MVRTRIGASESFIPQTNPAALHAFTPDVAPIDSGGECALLRTEGSGATIVNAFYPKRVGVHTQVTMMFDSAGHLVRYSERRGIPRIPSTVGMSDAQRDSTIRTANESVRSTTVSLDYAIDQGVIMNRGGGGPTQAALGSVKIVEDLQKLGPPKARLERARRLCGV